MKKSLCFIALVLVAVLSIPSVPCFASEFQYRFLTSESVEDYWEQSSDNTLQSKIVRQSSSKITQDLHYFETYETQLQSFCSNYDQYLIGYAGQGTSTQALSEDFIIFGCPSDVICVYYYTSINASSWINNYCFVSDHAFSVYYNRFGQNYDLGSGNLSTLNATLNNEYYVAWVSAANMMQSVVSGDCPVYSFGAYGDPFGQKIKDTWDNHASLTNYNSGQIPFIDENGDTVDPSAPDVVYESNENHMYLKSCDVGFCKPYSMNDLSAAGGGYLYVKYSFDNWVNSHSSDYWVNIRTVVNVDGTQYSGINTRALDLNGVNVLTFAESTVPNGWGDEGLLFVEFPDYVVSTYKTGYVYNMPYLTFADTDSNGISNRSRFLGNGRNRLFLTPSGGRGVNITDFPLGQALQDIFQVNLHQRFTIAVTVWLQDTDNNRSGEFTKTFNLVTGVSTTTDTSITDNDNPFEPDPSLPDIPDGSGDDSYSLAPVVNNFSINGNIGFDPGYRELKQDLDADPDDNFTQYLAPFKNNEVGGFIGDFLDDMPSPMKTIFVGGFGVLTLLGIYRFIRRG